MSFTRELIDSALKVAEEAGVKRPSAAVTAALILRAHGTLGAIAYVEEMLTFLRAVLHEERGPMPVRLRVIK